MGLPRVIPLRGLAALIAAWALACESALPTPRIGPHLGDVPVAVPSLPPPGKVEIIPPRPKDLAGAVWMDGEWQWTGQRWSWMRGRWEVPPPASFYAPPRTIRLDDGTLLFLPGKWHPPSSAPSH